MVPVLGILLNPRNSGFPVTFPIWTHSGHRSFHKRTCRRPASFWYFLIFDQNQREVYHEVLIAGDLSAGDVNQASNLPDTWSAFPYGRSMSYTAEFFYGNDTVYFAQPSLSQFAPGGSGVGTFNESTSTGLKDALNDTLPLTGRNAAKGKTGVLLRYAPPAHQRCILTSRCLPSLRYPQWGIRIHCERLPNPEVNL